MSKIETIDELLHPKMGIYNPLLRFAFTNITEEEFVSAWNSEPIKIAAGKTVEVPHHLAVKFTKELVDKIMIANAKLNEVEFYKNNPSFQINAYRAPSSLGVPGARKVWEEKICTLIDTDPNSAEAQLQRLGIREQIMKDISAQPSQGSPLDNAPASVTEFSDLAKTE